MKERDPKHGPSCGSAARRHWRPFAFIRGFPSYSRNGNPNPVAAGRERRDLTLHRDLVLLIAKG